MDVVHTLRSWSDAAPQFVVGGNEAGMKLGADIRAADAAVWLRESVGVSKGRLRPVPPLLAVEVAGQDEDEATLRQKARWYLEHGVSVVWLVLPETPEVIVLAPQTDSRHARGERLPEHAALPNLAPSVDQFFRQLDQPTR